MSCTCAVSWVPCREALCVCSFMFASLRGDGFPVASSVCACAMVSSLVALTRSACQRFYADQARWAHSGAEMAGGRGGHTVQRLQRALLHGCTQGVCAHVVRLSPHSLHMDGMSTRPGHGLSCCSRALGKVRIVRSAAGDNLPTYMRVPISVCACARIASLPR